MAWRELQRLGREEPDFYDKKLDFVLKHSASGRHASFKVKLFLKVLNIFITFLVQI